ncbi:MAG: hypothetical protein OEW49_04695 [Nitrosopumilus sp.]|nr:hypothetical protein [Nitrosopumilus sp.]
MDENDLRLEDWKMAKDRIKHFDDIVMKTRVQGIPIATAMQIAAFVTASSVGHITTGFFNLPVFSLILISSIIYLVPVVLLDFFHFWLLLKAVSHAKDIESKPPFKGNLRITHVLSNNKYTALHSIGGYLIYSLVFGVGIYFAFFGAHDILSVLTNPS